jgi:hypothetical protein
MLLVCFSFFSTALADDSVNAPGVQIKSDGSVVAPGVKVTPDGNVSAPGVEVNPASQDAASKPTKGSGGKNLVIKNDSQTRDLACNGEIVVVNGNDNTINCHGKSAELSINGTGNTVNFKGTCEKLILTGTKNKAQMERVGSINAIGNDNRITWASASKGEKPSIVSTGQNNVIKKIK